MWVKILYNLRTVAIGQKLEGNFAFRNFAHTLFPMEGREDRLFPLKFRVAHRIGRSPGGWPARSVSWNLLTNWESNFACKPDRKRGPPSIVGMTFLQFFHPHFVPIGLKRCAQALCSSPCSVPRRFGEMPLSQLQLETLKNSATAIQIQEANPKKPGSKAFERFDRYKTATTIGDATAKGANWQDLTGDFEKESLKIPDLMLVDAAGPGSTKRAAPEGTPDREADARSKMGSTTTIVPKALIPEVSEPVSKVEMSAATIAALRGMMRDEIKNGMLEMEHRFTKQLDRAIGDMKEEMKVETTARQQLEERIVHLEQNLSKQSNPTPDAGNEGEVDKAVAVVGGFVDKAIEEVESLVEEMMRGVHGYKEVEIIDITPPLALATFDTPVQAMKFIRSQKRNATVQTNKLWVSENRSKSERMRCKAVSKLKKFLIELGEFEPSNIIVNYKSFKVMARINSKLVPVANVTADLDVEWLDINEEVSGAMTNFMSDLE